MKNMISHDLAAALINDDKMRDQYATMYLVQQEFMVALTAQLHLRGLVDVQAIADHILWAASAPELGELAPDLAQVLCGRLAERTGQAIGAFDAQPQ